MSQQNASKELIAGLQDAVAYAEGKPHKGKAYQIKAPVVELEPKAIRASQKLSQEAFADRYGLPVATLRNWEQGHRAPDTTARLLLAVIEKYPDEVAEVVAQQRIQMIENG